MSAAVKQRRKELAQARSEIRFAIETERERCGRVADAYRQRALDDGMLVHAAVAKVIAESIRAGEQK